MHAAFIMLPWQKYVAHCTRLDHRNERRNLTNPLEAQTCYKISCINCGASIGLISLGLGAKMVINSAGGSYIKFSIKLNYIFLGFQML